MAKSGEATKKSKKIGRQIGRPRGAKNRVRSVPSKASVLKSIWQRAERAKGTELGTELYIELVKLYEKVRLADNCPTLRSFRIQVLANEHSEVDMLWTIFVVLLILWLLGFSLHVGRKSDPSAAGCGVGGSGH